MIRRVLAAGLAASLLFGICLFAEESGARFERPALITSAGQSADVQIASVLAKRAGLEAVLSKMAGEGDLEGTQTLILVLGVSLKGLGAAGLDVDKERARVQDLLRGARERGIPVLCLHLGGEARRGEMSDGLIRDCLPSAAAAIVVRAGNADGLFTTLCAESGIPLVEVDRTPDAVEPLKNAFR